MKIAAIFSLFALASCGWGGGVILKENDPMGLNDERHSYISRTIGDATSVRNGQFLFENMVISESIMKKFPESCLKFDDAIGCLSSTVREGVNYNATYKIVTAIVETNYGVRCVARALIPTDGHPSPYDYSLVRSFTKEDIKHGGRGKTFRLWTSGRDAELISSISEIYKICKKLGR